MKLSYDRLLFGLGVFALLISAGFYVVSFNKDSINSNAADRVASNDYVPIPVPDLDREEAVWLNAEEQANGELYDVFTPPAIWIDKDGTFIFESPLDEPVDVSFGVYLAKLENEPYRIQLEGYVEEDFSDPRKSVLLLFDEEKRQRVRARIGQSVQEHEFMIYNFTIDRIRDSSGIEKLAVATILDFRDGRRIFLTHGKRKYKDNTTVVLRSKEDAQFEVRIAQKPPYEFRTANAKYILEKINLEESSVIVRKLGIGASEPENKTLYLRTSNESIQTSNKSLESESDTSIQFFDYDF